jgi:hypothetical protein
VYNENESHNSFLSADIHTTFYNINCNQTNKMFNSNTIWSERYEHNCQFINPDVHWNGMQAIKKRSGHITKLSWHSSSIVIINYQFTIFKLTTQTMPTYTCEWHNLPSSKNSFNGENITSSKVALLLLTHKPRPLITEVQWDELLLRPQSYTGYLNFIYNGLHSRSISWLPG